MDRGNLAVRQAHTKALHETWQLDVAVLRVLNELLSDEGNVLAVLDLRILAADGNVNGLQLCNSVGEYGKPQRGRRVNSVRAGNAIVAEQRRFKVGNGNFGCQMRPSVNLVKRHLLTEGNFALRAEPVFKRLVRDLVELAALCGAALEAVVFKPCEMAAALRGMRRKDSADDFAVVVLRRNAEVAR